MGTRTARKKTRNVFAGEWRGSHWLRLRKKENKSLFFSFFRPSSLTFLLGVIGNSLIVFAVFVYRRMKSSTNIFLASLAIADLLFCLICIPVKVKWRIIDSILRDMQKKRPRMFGLQKIVIMICLTSIFVGSKRVLAGQKYMLHQLNIWKQSHPRCMVTSINSVVFKLTQNVALPHPLSLNWTEE